ncbi:hypothetical protein B0H34DRAFT_124155 [Crassisporium funariophilum]|nr:hypothetical protein B0H34DRAFT_124155 [Crassisporium funariophilum]
MTASRMTDIFSWRHAQYVVPTPGKTTPFNALAMCTDTSVITGDLFLNGQGLLADFQSQPCALPANGCPTFLSPPCARLFFSPLHFINLHLCRLLRRRRSEYVL